MTTEKYREIERNIEQIDSTIDELRRRGSSGEDPRASHEADRLEIQRTRILKEFVSHWGPWEKTLTARHSKRPYTLDFLRMIFDEFVELHGDRRFGDDGAMIGGMGRCDEMRCVVIGQQKGRDLRERQKRNFGMPKPEGYRKAMRMMALAEKFRLPLIAFIDTPAADPGVESEERGISQAIAESMMTMFSLTVPVIVTITGEGGSGGALGIAVGNRISMLEHAIYSVIPPEGCAAILWRDPAKSAEAAEALKISADSALSNNLIDEIIQEPLGGAHRDPAAICIAIKQSVLNHYHTLEALTPEQLREERYEKFRSMGSFHEPIVNRQAVIQGV